jgi:hypothetical protein
LTIKFTHEQQTLRDLRAEIADLKLRVPSLLKFAVNLQTLAQ